MITLQTFVYYTEKLWNKAKEAFIPKDQVIDAVLLKQDWVLVEDTTANNAIVLPSVDDFEELYVEMSHMDGTIVHSKVVKVESLLFESSNTVYREILLDGVQDAQTYVTYNLANNSIIPTCIEGVDITESSDNVTTVVYIRKTMFEDGTAPIAATRIAYDGGDVGFEANNVQDAVTEIQKYVKDNVVIMNEITTDEIDKIISGLDSETV